MASVRGEGIQLSESLDDRSVPGTICLVPVTGGDGGDERDPVGVADLAEHNLNEVISLLFAVTVTDGGGPWGRESPDPS